MREAQSGRIDLKRSRKNNPDNDLGHSSGCGTNLPIKVAQMEWMCARPERDGAT
jgi:hypothetical protein